MSNEPAVINMERDGTGRFLPGHSVRNPGNPQLSLVYEIRQALVSATNANDAAHAMRRLVQLMDHKSAKVSLAAIKEYLDRVAGKPALTVEVGPISSPLDLSRLAPERLALLQSIMLEARDQVDA